MIVLLLIINTAFLVWIVLLYRQTSVLNHLKKNYSAVVVLQKIMEVLGKKIAGTEKLEKINNILIVENDIKYSTIVSYGPDGHILKVSNVNAAYRDALTGLSQEPAFKNNIFNNIPKYVTCGYGDYLRYPSALERGIRSAMLMPLYLEGAYAGFWLLEDERPNAFDALEKVQLSILKENLVLIIENSTYQSTIEKMAVSDRLTGLYNRYYLYSKAKSIINDFPVSTVVIADIDHFKSINDTYGHDIGDKVLVSMVQTTLKCLSKEDIFVRFGGEEFVILFPGKSTEVCKQKVDEIREIISKTKFPIGETGILNVTVSYGMSTYQHGGNLEVSLKNADVALYRAKESGRNRVEVG